MGKTYLTTTLPYVNAEPHIGFALELVQADAYVRYRRLTGDEVFFNTGTDEHGQKVWKNAKEAGKEPKTYADGFAERFKKLDAALGLSEHAFIRTTDAHHVAAAQEFWKRCEAAGDIYTKHYQVKYCVGCELEKTDSELENGHCILHPNLEIELIDEENYFFRFSKYQDALLALYEREDFLVPPFRLNEIQELIRSKGLQDFSISRRADKMPWGVPVPGDPSQVMYVWFDALVNYISTLGWPEDEQKFSEFWGTKEAPNAVQVAGKDQVRQQSAMWQAMLMSAGLPPTKQIFIHGFITSGGQKMSKSLGNVIDPFEVVEKYGTDAVRYFLLRHIHPTEDSDFTEAAFREAYDANLANGLGNLVARVMKLAEDNLEAPIVPPPVAIPQAYKDALAAFEFNRAMDVAWGEIQKLDQRITAEEPFKLVKIDPEKGKAAIASMVADLYQIVRLLHAPMPATHEKIKAAILANKKPENLFKRLD